LAEKLFSIVRQEKNKGLDDTGMNDLEKLQVVLPHWIEHNIGHGSEFAKWAETLNSAGEEEIAGLLKKAEAFLQEADSVLKEALIKAGSDMTDGSHHHHSHHHDH